MESKQYDLNVISMRFVKTIDIVYMFIVNSIGLKVITLKTILFQNHVKSINKQLVSQFLFMFKTNIYTRHNSCTGKHLLTLTRHLFPRLWPILHQCSVR